MSLLRLRPVHLTSQLTCLELHLLLLLLLSGARLHLHWLMRHGDPTLHTRRCSRGRGQLLLLSLMRLRQMIQLLRIKLSELGLR